LRAELDYRHEARNAERFLANLHGDPSVHIPRVFWDVTTSAVLTLERLHGIKIISVEALDACHIDRSLLAERAARVILKMVFEDGFYHADPHPGNFLIEPGGRIGLLDFGMTGVVDRQTQEHLGRLLIAITSQDRDGLVDVLLDLGVSTGRVDRNSLSRDLGHLLSRYYGQTIGEIALGSLLNDALAIIRRHHLHLPANLALLVKTILMSESVGAKLDPAFHLATVIAPYAEGLVRMQYSPWLWAGRMRRASVEMARLGVDIPKLLRRLIVEMERGSFEVGARPEGFEPVIRRLERLANRIVLGVLAAAFINGLAVLTSVYRPPGWERWAWAVFTIGFLFAAVLGGYLAWSILRPGRRR
jgi:ubiquinone biosynthesis protein